MTTHEFDTADLTDPVWTIQHLAGCFHVTVDTAREYTYREDFPGSHLLGSRLLWDRDAVLSWFRALPCQTAADRRRRASAPPAPAAPIRPAATYRRRATRSAA